MSIYLLSKKNLARPATDLEAAIEFVITFLENTLATLCKYWQPKVKIAGNLDCIPLSLKNALAQQNQTLTTGPRRLYLCVAYDPWDEIAMNLREMEKHENADKLIQKLWVPEPIDLVLRTGGSRSLSHFLPLQCSYATLAFLDKLFNDTTILDIFTVIRHYDEEEHRFGL
jgi:undecaprenyl diphosphate synthase